MATTDREDAILIKTDGLKLPGKPHNQPMKQRIMDAAQRIIDRNPPTPEPPTLVSLAISPATVSVPVNTLQQFTAQATWSDGTTALPELLWTTTGGAIDTNGLWLGTGTAGSYQVGCTGGGKTATASITVSAVTPPPDGGVTYFDEDWSSGDKSRNQGGFRWGIANAGSGDVLPTVTTVNPYPGKTHSLQFQYAGNPSLSDDSNSEQRFIFGQNVKEVYCRAYLYFPDGSEGLGSARFEHRYPGSAENNNKLFLLWDVEYGNYHVAHTVQYRTTESIAPDSTYDPNIGVKYANGTQSGVGQHGVMAGGYIGGSIVIDDAIRGRWSKWQWHVKVGTTSSSSSNLYAATGDGVSELWIDDVLRFSRKNLPLYSHYPNANNWFQNGYILGWANSGFAQTTRIWVGPITFAPAFITD